ncbi:unnamed protein product, partial [Musa banksii]
LTDYLHGTRALPFFHFDYIASHSPFALSAFVAQVPLPPDAAVDYLRCTLTRFLPYHPVNEFEFFFESIGLPASSCAAASSSRSIFLSDDAPLLAAARGFHRVCVIGICLAFPTAMTVDAEPGGEIDRLLQDLRTVFVDFSLAESVPEDNVDVFLQICRRIRKVGPFILGCPDILDFDLENPIIAMPE